MTVVSSKEFVTNQRKYFDLALNEQICIKRGNNLFRLIHSPIDEKEEDDDAELLALAKSRVNGEFTSADDFIKYLRR